MVAKIRRAILWLGAAAYVVAGVVTISGAAGQTGHAASLGRAHIFWGSLLLGVGAFAAFATFRGNKSREWPGRAAGALCLGLLVALYAAFWIDMEGAEVRRRQSDEEVRSGRYHFGEQPALLAVAQAMAANDQDAIRAAAKAVPDLQTPGRNGATLLCWAIRETWQRPELVEAVRTLLSLGANPNHTNGERLSFAMAEAVHGPVAGLAAMLDAGGDPNARDELGRPIILMNWHLGYYKEQAGARARLLLERGADINSTMPNKGDDTDGYTLLLHRLSSGGPHDRVAYADALYFLERGADPHRAGADGMTFAKMLAQHREQFAGAKGPPPEFTALWDWAQARGLLSQ